MPIVYSPAGIGRCVLKVWTPVLVAVTASLVPAPVYVPSPLRRSSRRRAWVPFASWADHLVMIWPSGASIVHGIWSAMIVRCGTPSPQ